MTWVHIAEADSFLSAHARFGAQPLNQAGRDGYVADMARIGTELGVPDPPRTEAELSDRIASYLAELAGTAQAREAARFLLLTPPLPAVARLPYAVLAAAAVSLLPGWARRPLRLPRLPVTEAALVRPAGHAWFMPSAGPPPRPQQPTPARQVRPNEQPIITAMRMSRWPTMPGRRERSEGARPVGPFLEPGAAPVIAEPDDPQIAVLLAGGSP